VNFQWFPSNFHIYPHQSEDAPHLFGNLVPCSFLTSCLCSFSYLSCGDVICATFAVYLVACTTNGIVDGSGLPLIIFCALGFELSCSFFTLKPKTSPSSTLFFLLWTFFSEFIIAFFLFSNVVYISSLILLILVSGFYGFFFWWTNKYQKIFANTKAD